MNARQSLVGFDFSRFNRDYLADAQAATNGNKARNDAERYGVRVIPAQVEPGEPYWRVIGVRHLEPAENTGKHNLYAEILDEQGGRVRDDNVQLQRGWEGQRPDEKPPLVRFDKGENEPATNIPIDRNQKLWVRVAGDLPSDTVENLHTKHADEPGPNGELWNSIGHHSFYVVFQRATGTATVTQPVIETPVIVPPVTEPPVTKPVEPPPHAAAIGDDATYMEGFETLPALAVVQPGQRFEQSWRVQNSGSNAWDETYRLVRVGGASLNAPAHSQTPICHPGSETTVTVAFTAPAEPGPYHSVWRMANAAGQTFGERLWLVIVVAASRDAVQDGTARPAARNVRPSTTPSSQSPEATKRLPEAGDAASAARDPELYAAWKTHIENGFANNQLMFQQLLNGFMNPYWTTVWMYRILFGLGVASFLVAAGLSAFSGKEGYTLIFGGLSALSLLAYFFNRPLQALEENLQFITWLGLIYNSYWTRLVYLNSQPDVQQGLQDATDDAIQRIKELMDAHAKRAGKRQPLGE